MSKFPPIPFHSDVEVLFEDDRFVVIDKPAGLLSHPNTKLEIHEAVVQSEYDFKYECYRIGTWKFFLLHRIDRETSGCLLFTKDPDCVKQLKSDFENHLVHKEYVALLAGFVRKPTVWKDHLIKKPGKVFIDQRLKPNASTKVKPLEVFSKERMTLVCFVPQTGRTHQLRVQSQGRHAGILGDRQYGDFNRNKQAKQKWDLKRMMLHASQIAFKDPFTKKTIRVSCPFPEDFETIVDQLRKKMTQPWFVYIIETVNNHLYTGITTDVEKRFKTHQDGKGAKFFRMNRPKKVVYVAKFDGKEIALQREIQIKKLSALEKRKLIQDSLFPDHI